METPASADHDAPSFLVAPDSFKGSLTSHQAAQAMEDGILRAYPRARVVKIPMADGGEGTLDAMMMAVGGTVRPAVVTGPLGDSVRASYLALPDGKTAIIEMAMASGLTLVPSACRDPLRATSFGTGEFIRAAIDHGCRNLVIGIGGSATNDGGMGMAEALGARFLDRDGRAVGRGGGELESVVTLDCQGLDSLMKGVEVTVACDVTAPLCGPNGAANVFGPQKGATPAMIQRLDAGLEESGPGHKTAAWTGCAGASRRRSCRRHGRGARCVSPCAASFRAGCRRARNGSRRSHARHGSRHHRRGQDRRTDGDGQGAPRRRSHSEKARGAGSCLSGSIGDDVEALYGLGISSILSIIDAPLSLTEAMADARGLLARCAERAVRLFMAARP